MAELSRFFGIIIRMFFDDHNPPHIHVEHSGKKATFDLRGNILQGDLRSKVATRLVREWIDLHSQELEYDWELAQQGKPLKKIQPLE